MTNHSKLIGAILIVAGTAIGAGMLALPLATAAIGFWPAMALMLGTWGFAAYSALIMLEVNLKVGSTCNYHHITGQVLGRNGQLVAMASMMALLYALTAAYLSGGGSLLALKLAGVMTLPTGMGPLLFAVFVGSVAALGVKYIDQLTKVLFLIMMAALAVVLLGLLPQVELANVGVTRSSDVSGYMAVLPVLITSFGFHASIPTLVRYLDGDVKQLRIALVSGSTLPLLCYALWLLAALGSLSAAERVALSDGDALAAMIALLSDKALWQGLSPALQLFADLALVTSFLGVSLSLFDYLTELFRMGSNAKGRIATWALTFLPPLALALFFPGGFVAVLGYAAVPLVVLMVLLPALMAAKLRTQQSGYQVTGGKVGLALAALVGLVVIVAQVQVA
ncbi:amino acid permease [Ferrimonas senticii]|uniref:amino acid permease n=1 Tax=Ferrimonas senticii TaxID=394566 RepID=UPI000409673E|nr:aromatic amino acid transport family protein [Ferrimonas senticii]